MHISAKAVIMKKNKFLLQLRDNKKNIYAPNSWGFFGGRAEKNEKIETCIKREINEELSVKCVKAKKSCETVYRKKVLLVFFNVCFQEDFKTSLVIGNIRLSNCLGRALNIKNAF